MSRQLKLIDPDKIRELFANTPFTIKVTWSIQNLCTEIVLEMDDLQKSMERQASVDNMLSTDTHPRKSPHG